MLPGLLKPKIHKTHKISLKLPFKEDTFYIHKKEKYCKRKK